MKRVAILYVLMISVCTCFGQSFNIKAGVNIANQYPAVEFSFGSKKLRGSALTRFHIGVSTDIKLAKNWFLRPGLTYSGQGYHMHELIDFAGNLQAAARDFKLNYINMPVQALYAFDLSKNKKEKQQLWIAAGVYAGALINGKTNAEGGPARDIKIGNEPGDEFNFLDAGVNVSTGLRYRMVFLEAGYQYGLTESGRFWAKGKNRVISLGIGIMI